MRLDRKIRRRIFARSFFLQATWDFRHMQGIGFAFGLYPLLRRLYPHAEQRTKAVRRHLEFFNTQPYMAGIALGVAARQEQEIAEQPSAAREARVAQLKRSMGSALAAIGDPLFWGAWRPFCAITAAILILVIRIPQICLWIVAASVILYNIPVWVWRWNGVRWGFEDGERVVVRLSEMRLQRRLKQLRWGAFVLALLGGAILLLAPPWIAASAAIKLCLIALCVMLKKDGWSAFDVYPALIALGVVIAVLSLW